MKTFLGFLCFILITQGAGGLVCEFTDGRIRHWAITSRLGFLDGYEIYTDIGLIVLGIALAAARDSA